MVNRGYQQDDREAIDYQLWKLPGTDLECRGPGFTQLPKRFFTAVGAAQTFGRFVARPYCELVAERSGLSGVNLGFSGAGPTFFSRNPELMGVINHAEFAIVQFMSGRSLSNSRFVVQFNQGLVRPRFAAPEVRPVFAADAYRRFLEEEALEEVIRLRAEIRVNYVAEMKALLDKITVPVVLLYWSTRPPGYREGTHSIAAYWGDFPHFVTAAVVSQLRGCADRCVDVVTNRGLPQPIFDRAGKPLLLWPEDRFPDVELRTHNHYYPSPEMHADAADALCAALPVMPAPRARPTKRDVLVHVHIFRNAAEGIDDSLRQHFGAAWTWLRPPQPGTCIGEDELIRVLAAQPETAALSSLQLRFPLDGSRAIRLRPLLLLRHPIDRVRAIYQYERREERQRTSQLIHTVQAGKLGFPEWVEWCLSDPGLEAPIGNLQTRVCSFRHNGRELSDWGIRPDVANLAEALSVIAELPVVGIAEEFQLTAALFAACFGPIFPGLDFLGTRLPLAWQGRRATLIDGELALDGDSVAARLAAMRIELGRPLYLRLLQANELDLELYAHARRRLGIGA